MLGCCWIKIYQLKFRKTNTDPPTLARIGQFQTLAVHRPPASGRSKQKSRSKGVVRTRASGRAGARHDQGPGCPAVQATSGRRPAARQPGTSRRGGSAAIRPSGGGRRQEASAGAARARGRQRDVAGTSVPMRSPCPSRRFAPSITDPRVFSPFLLGPRSSKAR